MNCYCIFQIVNIATGLRGANMKEQLDRIQELENLISKLPQGSITYKTIHGKKQPYLQWTENGKTRTSIIIAQTLWLGLMSIFQ